MSGDYSRIAFDPMYDDLGVLLQQGRPLTDADWNALVLQLRRRVHVETMDTFGVATVPAQTPDGFKIVPNGSGGIAIDIGRLYADGLQAENHGAEPLTWDSHLEELIGTEPIDYTEQPYYPNPDPLPDSSGPHLVYLDVWQREVTHLMRAGLIEKAVGVDTCTRLQTVWQVKLLADVGDATCSTSLEQFPGWLPAHAPSGGRLSTSTVPVPGEPDPCLIPLLSGYKGDENQCYRLQIHDGGPLGVATFKWSRDNGSVGARVTHIPSGNTLVVDSIGKDALLRFSEGDWVNVIDDVQEFHNLPGELKRVKSVDDPTRTITLETALPNDLFPTDPMTNETDPDRHTRIQRWDQGGTIRDENGNELQNLNLPSSTGAITVPTGNIGVLLEHNIVAKFSIVPQGAEFRSGDYWIFEARAVDGSINELVEAPPRGIHHHYAKLALATLPEDIVDCRHLCDPCESGAPPPPGPGAAESCACTVCVTAAQHDSGQLTVQAAIDQVVAAGGGNVCLVAGLYQLAQPLSISNASSLRLVGKGLNSELQSEGAILSIQGSTNIALEAFAMVCRPPSDTAGAALSIRSSDDIAVERVAIRVPNQNPTWSAIGLLGELSDIRLTANTLSAFVGVRSAGPTGGQTDLTDLRIDDNTFACKSIAIQLTGPTVHHQMTRLRGNRVMNCELTGFVLTGSSEAGAEVDIAGNLIAVQGSGIEAALDRLRVFENDIQATAPVPGNHRGVSLVANMAANQNGPEFTQIVNNRIVGFQEAAIVARVPALRALEIKGNQIELGGGGVILEVPGLADQLVIENNQLSRVRGIGIRGRGDRARIVTSGNHIETEGGHPPAELVFPKGEGVFTDNHCRRSGGVPGTPDVLLGADTLIVTSNRVHGSETSSVNLQVERPRYTLLGNIVTGTITVNGGPVEQKWQPLNLQNVL